MSELPLDEPTEKFRAVIQIAKITPPTGRGRSARVDTVNGATLWIWPNKVGLLREGEEYEVEGNVNLDYHNITKVRHIGPYRPPKQPAPNAPAMQPKTLQPKQQNGKHMEGNYYKPRSPDEQRQIWVCALLGREIDMGRGFLSEEVLIARGKVHKKVWEELFGAGAEQEVDDSGDDSGE
jgi:hypothetical protein